MVKHQNVSKHYEADCPSNFLLLLMFLLTAKSVRNSHTLGSNSKKNLRVTESVKEIKFEGIWIKLEANKGFLTQ